MTRALILSLLLATPLTVPVPVHAQQQDDGFNLMEEGAKLFFRGLMSEMEPALDEMERTLREMQPLMQDFVTQMGPALRDIMEKVDDWTQYDPPVMLPNGDILIRRKTPLTPDAAPPDGKIDL